MTPAKLATIKILDETNVAIIGLTRSEYDFFYKKYGLFVPSYRFNPKYKLGRWDGKKRFFTSSGSTFLNLLPEIIPSLKQMGYKIKLIDNRVQVSIEIPLIDKHYFKALGWILGDHQVMSVNGITQNGGGIVKAGTGSGKTIITAVLCDLYRRFANLRVITIVPNSDLISQTILELQGVGIDVGEYSGDKKDVNHDHVVSTWQALQNNPKVLSMFQVVIVDECHGAKGNVLQKLVTEDAAHMYIRIGLTGTLPEDECDAMSVRVSLGDVVYEVPAHVLIEQEWLAQLQIESYQLHEDLTAEWKEYLESEAWQKFQEEQPAEAKKYTYKKFRNDCFPDFPSEVNYLHGKPVRNRFITDLIQEARSTPKKGNTFVLVKGLAFGKKLTSMIPNAVFVYGKDHKKVRQQIYSLFETHDDIVVVSTFQLASTGLNIKRIFHLFLIDAGKSFIQVIQSIGRGLRKAHDKDSVTVNDISSDLKYSRRHLRERLRFYSEQKYKFRENKINYEELYKEALFSVD